MDETHSIGVAGATIRDLVNSRNIYDRHFKGRSDDWNRLTVAMDTLGDSSEALSDFEEHGFGENTGARYLRFYGTLQAIILQQDSIIEHHRIFLQASPAVPSDSAWLELRRLRNLASGHPLNKKGDPIVGELRTFVNRNQMSPDRVQLLLCEQRTGATRFEAFELRSLMDRYKVEALVPLNAIIEYVRQRWP